MMFLFFRKEVKSTKSAKPASAPKATKDAAKSPKVAKPKEKAATAYEFDEEEVAPEAKKQKTTPTKGKLLLNFLRILFLPLQCSLFQHRLG